jgi:hypothetical protein
MNLQQLSHLFNMLHSIASEPKADDSVELSNDILDAINDHTLPHYPWADALTSARMLNTDFANWEQVKVPMLQASGEFLDWKLKQSKTP